MKAALLADLKWALPAGVALGTLLAAFQSDFYLQGWMAFVILSVLGTWLLTILWRWAGGGRALMIVIAAAFFARLAGGVALHTLLPVFGYDQEVQRAGYVFYDAFKRDGEAWALARSADPLWAAIGSENYSSDQYGGLLMLSGGIYRTLSNDVHRPLLIVLVSAIAGALAIPFVRRALDALFDEKISLAAAWILALYPESVLLGSAQMREPFLIAFLCVLLWGFAIWETRHNRAAWGWMILGIAGLLTFSPGIALAAIAIFGGWHVVSGSRRRTSWMAVTGLAAIFILTLLFFSSKVAQTSPEFDNESPLVMAWRWLALSSQWDFYLLEKTSGIVQYLMTVLPSQIQIPFLVGYGVTQPLLPAVLVEPAALIWKVVGIGRALGWYAILPFLVYGFFAINKLADSRQKRVFLWLELFTWGWILLVSARGGADQWDNPRYRTIILPFMAIIVSWGWQLWRENGDRWLGRIASALGIFVLTFLAWYLGRYNNFPKFDFSVYIAIAVVAIVIIFAGDIGYEIFRKKRNS